MSSTTKKRSDRGTDFYETPEWVVGALSQELFARGEPVTSATRLCDPSAGRGAILKAFGWPPESWGFEVSRGVLYPASEKLVRHVIVQDALGPAPWFRPAEQSPMNSCPELVVMNPPYTHALEFCARAIAEARALVRGDARKIRVWALLRLGFMASQKRAAFHGRNPSDVLVLPRRPSFTGGGTDSADYAWFGWGPGATGQWKVLPCG